MVKQLDSMVCNLTIINMKINNYYNNYNSYKNYNHNNSSDQLRCWLRRASDRCIKRRDGQNICDYYGTMKFFNAHTGI